jgi:hypothetical protein
MFIELCFYLVLDLIVSPPVNGILMGNNFNTATLDDATMVMIRRKTKMKNSEITNWFNELKVTIERGLFSLKQNRENKEKFMKRFCFDYLNLEHFRLFSN